MDWNDLRHFLALARSGSVRAAGASLGVSHSTVARRVDALEEQLAVRLFDRNRDGYMLTAAGQQLLPGAERVEREMSALERNLVGQDERLEGTVALTCCDHFVSDILVREFTPFCNEYPDIELCLTTDSRSFNLSKREADIAVRILARSSRPPEHLIARKLAPVTVCSYVATAHASRLDPERPDTRWLAFDDRRTQQHLVQGSHYPDLPLWGSFASLDVLLQTALMGLGLVILPTYVGDREPGLQRLPHPDLRQVADLWMLSHTDLRDNARFRVARARVAQALTHHLPLFRGEGWPTAAPVGSENAPDGDPDDCVD